MQSFFHVLTVNSEPFSGRTPGIKARISSLIGRLWVPGTRLDRRTAPTPAARSWFFVGDTIDWLKTYSSVSGVGRVTYELLMASLDHRGQRFTPCILADTPSGLAAVSAHGTDAYLSARVGRNGALYAPPEDQIEPPAAVSTSYPLRGNHVIFTGVVWTRQFAQLFRLLRDQDVEFSVLVYDIIPIESPDLVGDAYHREFTDWLTITIALARLIYVSSPSNRDAIIRWSKSAGVDVRADIVVIPFGVTVYPQNTSSAGMSRSRLIAEGYVVSPFVLSVGTIDKRKNQALLCRTWSRLTTDLGAEHVPQLVLVGRDDLDLARSSGDFAELIKEKKIVILQDVSDIELFELYRICSFTVFPSTSEGYGLPVAESLAVGKLCVASDLPAIREHAGTLPWYFDPADGAALLALLRRAIAQPAARQAAEQRIAAEYHAAPWSTTLEAIKRAISLTRR
jgi:glycosyltransferase involved in cell wall biosynthesis